jgi:hypothetical protein
MGNYGADPAPQLPKIRKVAFDFNFVPQDDLKVDQFSTVSSNKVYSVVRKIGSTRLKFLVDPSQIPP